MRSGLGEQARRGRPQGDRPADGADMADVDFDDFGGWQPTVAAGPNRAQRIINIAGAASSIALVIGLGIWGYKIAVRDVNGVPVIRAMAGPMRIAPEDPGGTITENQGLAVNDIAAVGTVTPPSDRLVLAPRGAGLDEGDAAGLSELMPMEETQSQVTAAAAEAPASEAAPAELAMAAPEAALAAPTDPMGLTAPEPGMVDPAAVADALADALTDGAAPLLPEPVADLPQGAMPKSLRPASRPSRVASADARPAPLAVEAVQSTTASVPVPAEITPASIAAGARLVQLGAYDTADQARGEWGKMQARFPDLLASKSLVVQSAESGGRTFYRLRAHGFDGEDDARRFCTALLAEGAACIPVVQR